MLHPFIGFWLQLLYSFVFLICLLMFIVLPTLIFISKHIKPTLHFVSVNSNIWCLYGIWWTDTVSASFYLWCHVSLCVMLFLSRLHIFSTLLVEIIEAWVEDEFLQKGFVSDRLLGALLNCGIFKWQSQLGVLWIIQIITIWASYLDCDLGL